MQMRERTASQLQQVQQMLGYVNPNDPLFGNLQTQQAELAKQLREITQQIQMVGQQPPDMQNLSGRDRDFPAMPISPPTAQPGMGGMEGMPGRGNTVLPPDPYVMPGLRHPSRQEMPSPMPNNPNSLHPGQPHDFPYAPTPTTPSGVPNWASSPWESNQERPWEPTPWGPRLPRELSEVKQSIEFLQRKVAELKETVKALETQIQLLNRNILLLDRVQGSRTVVLPETLPDRGRERDNGD
jgi:DNA repair exonuclease SbcCD ATPase subunit